MTTNPELELAFEYVNATNRHIFLTGKAGTGKTTFLHRIRDQVPKRMAVVAPTGVAAINARGVTIHSLFQLPFGVLTPDRIRAELPKRRFSGKKINLLKSLDLLVIDEISMVRADVLDALDAVLRRYRRNRRPFGGLQLLMIGDLHQLPPVVKDQDWEQLRPHYDTAYFFGSLALRQAKPTVVQLKHIYRQSDGHFIDLLNKVRNNRIDATVLEQLNSRYRPDFRPYGEEGYITLTSHNRTARAINTEKLAELPGQATVFQAEVNGDFPESMYPNEPELHFKVGAQVMFNKNDSYPDRLYYNGKIGRITAIAGEEITVQCPGEAPITVGPVAWENRKYSINSVTKEVSDSIVGTYTQHPLRLAWAITIHKSQGLTFERVVIDAEAAFAHGQVYVALSRCKSFEGDRKSVV
jgi:ATP-dependent exoDNAse (exonuclease V) alpha subunit